MFLNPNALTHLTMNQKNLFLVSALEAVLIDTLEGHAKLVFNFFPNHYLLYIVLRLPYWHEFYNLVPVTPPTLKVPSMLSTNSNSFVSTEGVTQIPSSVHMHFILLPSPSFPASCSQHSINIKQPFLAEENREPKAGALTRRDGNEDH